MGTNITGIGNANAIGFKSRVTGGIYFPPELKDALVGVWSAYGKSNDSTDRNIIKNKIKDRGGDFVISNAAFKLNSGFGGFVEDFTSWDRIDASTAEISNDGSKIKCINTILNVQYLFNSINKDIPSFKVKISNFTKGNITYYYRKEDGIEAFLRIEPSPLDKVLELPKSYNTVEGGTGSRGGFYSSNINIGVTIEQIPSFEGAFVTDGVNDLITSTKTVQEMLGGSNKCTVLSMMCQIGDTIEPFNRNNWLLTPTSYLESRVEKEKTGKTGIYGYTSTDISNGQISNINTILGDKDDYTVYSKIESTGLDYFSVEGFTNKGIWYTSSVAWYWTIIANKVLTTDEINQVIAYYNLDRCVEPTVLYDVKRQGLSNDTPDSDWYLKDFSKNGFDMSLFNFAKKGNSGVGKYETDLSDTRIWTQSRDVTSSPFSSSYNGLSGWIIFANTKLTNSADMPSFKIQVKGLLEGQELIYRYYDSTGQTNVYSMTKDGEYTLPSDVRTAKPLISNTSGFQVVKNDTNSITITQIPSHAGALCLDGVNDFGKVTGMPVYKDYTVVTDREIFANIGAISSKNNPGAFVEIAGNSAYSFGQATSGLNFISTRSISYLSKYSYCGQSITAGAAEDGTDMWLGTIRDNDYRFFNGAIYSLMTFPYSMSEFLIERQLKKHKLGTLYPNMVEFRSVIKSNASYGNIVFYYKNEKVENGTYLTVGSSIGMHIRLSSNSVNEIKSITINGIPATFKFHNANNNIYQYDFNLTSKSPQKINITIDEYIRYEDIVQPYPVLLRFNDENGNEVSWGGKFRVGSTITRIGSAADSNLLPNIYNIFGLLLNDNQVTSSKFIVEKTMVFKAKSAYIFDNNEPNCILSPRLLRIPNSSYKILGYIPDISGHGNHGKINNSAYAGMSGANGYVENFTTWGVYNGAILTDNTIKTNSNFNPANSWVAYKSANTILNSFSVNITGIPEGGILNFRVNADTFIELSNGRNDLSFDNILITVSSGFRITKGANLDWSNLVIQQIGEYEGAYCLDGVDDFITIPTTVGGKQVLMKTNWLKSPTLLYDQRASGSFAIITTNEDDATNPRIAYQARNLDGKTYIDGIENNYIETYSLKGITHNITVTNPSAGSGVVPVIGANTGKSNSFAKMSLYDFMLFDEISTDDKIKELNEYVGIEGNTEWRKTE